MPSQTISLKAGTYNAFRVPIPYNNLMIIDATGTVDVKDARSNVTKKLKKFTGIHYNQKQDKGLVYLKVATAQIVEIFYGDDEELKQWSSENGTVQYTIAAGPYNLADIEFVFTAMYQEIGGGQSTPVPQQTIDGKALVTGNYNQNHILDPAPGSDTNIDFDQVPGGVQWIGVDYCLVVVEENVIPGGAWGGQVELYGIMQGGAAGYLQALPVLDVATLTLQNNVLPAATQRKAYYVKTAGFFGLMVRHVISAPGDLAPRILVVENRGSEMSFK